MKMKILALGVLSFVGVVLSAAEASAFFWNRHINRYSTFIACRPYNAFTPICYGSLVCDGCCPSMGNGCGPSCGPIGAQLSCCDGYPAPGAAYAAGPMLMPLAQPFMPPAGPAQPPNFTPPPPTASPPAQMSMVGFPNGIQTAGYYPGYYPNYYPVNYGYYPMPQPTYPPMAVPSYWYGRR